jgi:hypothetical protein
VFRHGLGRELKSEEGRWDEDCVEEEWEVEGWRWAEERSSVNFEGMVVLMERATGWLI